MSNTIDIIVEKSKHTLYKVTIEDELNDHDNYEKAIRLVELNPGLAKETEHIEYDAWDCEQED